MRTNVVEAGTGRLARCHNFFTHYLLPIGLVALLTGMFWVGERNAYHRLFYVFFAAPTLIALLLSTRPWKSLLSNPLFLSFLAFSCYMLLTLTWAGDLDDRLDSLLKRPLFIALLFFGVALVAMRSPQRLDQVVRAACWIAVLSAVLSLGYFVSKAGYHLPRQRFSGYGALYNALLSAHVYGAFAAIWLTRWFQSRSPLNPAPIAALAVLGVLLLATGSRTPLVGMIAALLWLLVACNVRRGSLALAAVAVLLALQIWLYPDLLAQRGVSHRPTIWLDALRQISEKPWFGHGFGHPIRIQVPGQLLADPHNMELGVLYAGGIVGLALWATLYGFAMTFAWKNRSEPLVLIAATWLVFGLGAGLTEGMAFLSRPKEHWFLIWLPMAFLYAQWVRLRLEQRQLTSAADDRRPAES
jgi:O-antigen ligase